MAKNLFMINKRITKYFKKALVALKYLFRYPKQRLKTISYVLEVPKYASEKYFWQIPVFFYLGFLSQCIHKSHGSRGRGTPIVNPHYHFQPIHKYLNISQAITAESSLWHITSDRARTRNLSFSSASHSPLYIVSKTTFSGSLKTDSAESRQPINLVSSPNVFLRSSPTSEVVGPNETNVCESSIVTE